MKSTTSPTTDPSPIRYCALSMHSQMLEQAALHARCQTRSKRRCICSSCFFPCTALMQRSHCTPFVCLYVQKAYTRLETSCCLTDEA